MYFGMCSHYVDAEETFPEVGGCRTFKNKTDFVEVVRCKDCKEFKKRDDENEIGWCPVCRFVRRYNDFCSYGERRGGE